MASLEKLGILGVRSFSPHCLETIKFDKPLTIIVGHNGAGKTTIVECLRMATTGEVPPSANKGQSFLHDPRLAGAGEVKGQIRLVFSTSAGIRVVTVRNFQVSCVSDKRGTRSSFKALEAVVQVKDQDGNTKSTSNKCVDVNTAIAGFMGLPKAVLDNVIFCHQEDGNWPLSDMATLKKRFDELFGSSRFTKALEVISNLRKKYTKEAKDKFHDLELIQKDLSQMEALKGKISDCREKEAQLETEIGDIITKCTEAEEQVTETNEKLMAISGLERELKVLSERIHQEEANCATFQSELREIYSEGYEQLLSIRESFEAEAGEQKGLLEEMEGRVKICTEKFEKAIQQCDSIQQKSLQFIRAEGQLESLKASLGTTCSELDEILDRGGQLWAGLGRDRRRMFMDLRSNPSQLGIVCESVKPLMEDFQSGLRAKYSRLLETAEEEICEAEKNKSELQDHRQELLNSLSEARIKLEQLRSLTTQVDEVEKEVAECKSTLALQNREAEKCLSIDTIRIKFGELRTRREQLNTQLEFILSSLAKWEEKRDLNEKINSKTLRQREFRDRLTVLEKELGEGVKSLREFNVAQSQLFGLNQHISHEWESRILEMLRSCEIQVSDQQEVVHQQTLNHGQAKQNVETMRRRIEEASSKMEELQTSLTSSLGHTDVTRYSQDLLKSKEEVEENMTEMLIAKNADSMYNNYFQYSVKKNKCAFCTRPFAAQLELDDFTRHMTHRISKLPYQVEEAEKCLKISKECLRNLEKCHENMSEFTNLATIVLPDFESKLKPAVQNEELSLEAMTQSREALDHGLAVVDQLKRFKFTFDEWSSVRAELDVLEKVLEELRLEVSHARENVDFQKRPKHPSTPEISGVSLRAREKECRKALADAADEEMRLKEREFDVMGKQAALDQSGARLAQLELKLATLRKERSETNNKASHVIRDKKVLDEQMAQLDKYIGEQSHKLSRARDAKTQVDKDAFESAKAVTSIICLYENLHQKLTNDLKELHAISSFVSEFDETKENLRKAERVLNTSRSALDSAKEELNNEQRKITERLDLESNLHKNILLHEMQRKLQELRDEFRAKSDLEEGNQIPLIKQAATKARQILDEYNAAKSQKTGEKLASGRWRSGFEDELSHPRFKDLVNRHSDCEVDYFTLDSAASDLRRYYTALDRALMIYHAEKMKEINNSISQLWRDMYTGMDIDVIAIRSSTDCEAEGEAMSTAPSSGARSYNYRVVMVKGDVEIDMKGRCSAGQKVLACLVIRLALSESFAVQCGILTLDEPTTNLDRKNVESLARSLSDLIEARKTSSTFQLVIITHDEEFAEYLRRFSSADHFYRVKKSPEGFSTIRAIKF